MKKILFILITFILYECSNTNTYYKPFVIISKEFVFLWSISDETNRMNSDKCRYTYIDKYGSENTFQDYANRYNVGDTIK